MPAPLQPHIRIFPARPTPPAALIDRFARAGFEGAPPPVLAAEQAFIEAPATDIALTVGGGALTWPSRTPTRDRLYDLLPAFHSRAATAEWRRLARPFSTSSICRRTSSRRISGSFRKNAFVETCEPWAVAYIGDLVGTTPLFDESRVKDGDTAVELFRDLDGAEDAADQGAASGAPSGRCRAEDSGRSLRCARAPTSPRRSTTAGARARCRCSRSWRAT